MIDTNKYSYLKGLKPIPAPDNKPEPEQEKIQAGTYQARIIDVKDSISKKHNNLIITVFKIDNLAFEFNYIRTVPPTTIKTNKEKYIEKLFNDYITSLGINDISELNSVIGNCYFIELSYNNNFINVKVLGKVNNGK